MSRKINTLRDWQIKAVQIGRTARYFLCQAPGGSGKSFAQVLLAQADIEECGRKQLILVPRNHIHHTFWDGEEITFRLPASDHVSHWRVGLNLCLNSDCRKLKKWLLSDPDADTLAAITTHHAMVLVWQQLTKDEKRQALRKITFRIDEAHHISHVFHEADLELYNVKDRQAILDDGTGLGHFVTYALRHNDPTMKLHLTTATFFRGDRKTILSKAFRQEFAHYYLPWDEHFQTLGISDLRFDFVNYDDDPADLVVEAIRQEPDQHHLIIIPPLTHRYRTRKTLSGLMSKLLAVCPAAQILDLVTQKTQVAHKALLMKHPDAFKAVVACRLFDEGTDWVPCSRLHNTDAGEDSLTLAVQRFFRPLRMHKTKREVRIVNYIPSFSPDLEFMEQRAILSDRFNAVMACIVTQGELMPTFVTLKKPTEGKSHMRLQDLYGEAYPAVLEDLFIGYEHLPEKTGEAIEDLAGKILEQYGCPAEADKEYVVAALCAQVMRVLPKKSESERRTLVPAVIDADEIRKRGFDKIWPKDGIDSAIWWGTDKVDSGMIRELLGIIKPIPKLDEIHEAIRAYANRTGQRPTTAVSLWFDELGRSTSAVNQLLGKQYGTTLKTEVAKVLGDKHDGLIEQTHELIRDYWQRGIALTQTFGVLPEFGITAKELDYRLRRYHKTSLPQERKKVLGPDTLLPLDEVKDVLRKYLQEGKRITCDTKAIPELGMAGWSLNHRLQSLYGIRLPDLVDQLMKEVGVTSTRKPRNPEAILSLNKVKDVLRKHLRDGKQITYATKHIPELDLSGPALQYRLKSWYGIKMSELTAQLAKEAGVAPNTRKPRNPDKIMPLSKVKAVVCEYVKQGRRITSSTKAIPELGISGAGLNHRLRSWYGIRLQDLVDQVVEEIKVAPQRLVKGRRRAS
jgi:hypothetical protein